MFYVSILFHRVSKNDNALFRSTCGGRVHLKNNNNLGVNDDVTQLTSFLHRSCERQDTSLQLQATFGWHTH